MQKATSPSPFEVDTTANPVLRGMAGGEAIVVNFAMELSTPCNRLPTTAQARGRSELNAGHALDLMALLGPWGSSGVGWLRRLAERTDATAYMWI